MTNPTPSAPVLTEEAFADAINAMEIANVRGDDERFISAKERIRASNRAGLASQQALEASRQECTRVKAQASDLALSYRNLDRDFAAEREAHAQTRAEVDDWRDTAEQAARERCQDDAHHCTCVGPLRKQLKDALAASRTEVPVLTAEQIQAMDAILTKTGASTDALVDAAKNLRDSVQPALHEMIREAAIAYTKRGPTLCKKSPCEAFTIEGMEGKVGCDLGCLPVPTEPAAVEASGVPAPSQLIDYPLVDTWAKMRDGEGMINGLWTRDLCRELLRVRADRDSLRAAAGGTKP